MVLIMGLAMQLTAWPDEFCHALASRGFRVIRFDNRDAGLSTKMPSIGWLTTTALLAGATLRMPVRPPYGLATWRATPSGSWTRSTSTARTLSARRWGG